MTRSWKLSLPAVFVVVLSVGLVSGWWLREKAAAQAPGSSPVVAALEMASGTASAPQAPAVRSDRAFSTGALFSEALREVEAKYVEPLKLEDQRRVAKSAIQGMLQAVAVRPGWVDLYTRYLDPQEYVDFTNESQDAFFFGIGAQLEWAPVPLSDAAREALRAAGVRFCPVCQADLLSPDAQMRRVQIASPMPGYPAASAGIQPGDAIVGIDPDGTGPKPRLDAHAMTVDEAINLIRGPENTPVTLDLERASEPKPVTVTIVRRRINIEPVESKMLDGKTFYIRLSNFSLPAEGQIRAAIDTAVQQGAKGVVLDMRSNPGGLLTSAVAISRDFVPRGTILFVRERDDEELREYPVREGTRGFKLPLVVLVNRGTASGAEIVAGALKHHKVGTIIGERTWGKGLVQSILRLSDGSAMLLVTARYYTAGGEDINKQFDDKGNIIPDTGGVAPDITVEQPDTYRFVPIEQVPGKNDPILARGLEVLRERYAQTPK